MARHTVLMGAVTGGLVSGYYYAANGGAWMLHTAGMTGGICPVAGTITNLRFYLNTAAVTICRLRLYKNGQATDLAAAVLAGATNGSDTANEVTVVAGDQLTFYYTGDTGVAIYGYWVAEIDSGLDNFGIIMVGGFKGLANPTVGYVPLNGSNWYWTMTPTETEAYCVAPIACTISKLYIRNYAWPYAVTDTVVVTLRVNGVDSTLTATATGNVGAASDLTHSVAIAKGDRVNWSVLTSGADLPVISIGALVLPATEAYQQAIWISGLSSHAPSAAVAEYAFPMEVGRTICAVEAHNQLVAKANTRIGNLYVRLSAAPGLAASGKSYTFTIRVNGVDTALTCTVLEIATSAEDAVNVIDLAAGDLVSLGITPANAPDAAVATWGLVVYGLAPTVTAITPAAGQQGSQITVTLTGTNLEETGAVDMGDDITCLVTSKAATAARVTISIASGAALGARDITVQTAAGEAALAGGFTVVVNPATSSDLGAATAVATSIVGGAATLNGILEENAAAPCTVWFEWGTTTAYGMSTPKQTVNYKGASFSATISPLAAGVYYHYRAVIQAGGSTYYGNDAAFGTAVQQHLPTLMGDDTVRRLLV